MGFKSFAEDIRNMEQRLPQSRAIKYVMSHILPKIDSSEQKEIYSEYEEKRKEIERDYPNIYPNKSSYTYRLKLIAQENAFLDVLVARQHLTKKKLEDIKSGKFLTYA